MPEKRKPGDYPGNTFDERLMRLLEDLANNGTPVKITSRNRTAEEQAKLYAKGRTSGGGIVTEKSGRPGDESRHQKGLAADLAFVNGGFEGPWDKIGEYAKQEGLEWGGDWTSLKDRPHVQMPAQGNFPKGGSASGTTTSSRVTDGPAQVVQATKAAPQPAQKSEPLFPNAKLPDPAFLKAGQPVRKALDSGISAVTGAFASKSQPAPAPQAVQPATQTMPINYKALYDMSVSKDPEARKLAAQASKNMTPDELKEFFNFQNQLHTDAGVGADTSPDRNIVAGIPPEAAVAAPALLKGVVQGGIKGIGHEVGQIGKMFAVIKGMEAMGAPKEAITAVMIAMGLKGGGGAGKVATAEAEGAVTMSAEEKALRDALSKDPRGFHPETIEKIVQGSRGAAAPSTPGSNVISEGGQTGNYQDVSKGFHPGGGLFEFPKPPATRATTADYATDNAFTMARGGSPGLLERGLGGEQGKIADQEAFQRALDEELQWIQRQKGLTNSNSTTSSYDDWVAQQEAKFPPTGTSIKDLATKGSASLRKPK